jgi:hypothetical protein
LRPGLNSRALLTLDQVPPSLLADMVAYYCVLPNMLMPGQTAAVARWVRRFDHPFSSLARSAN